MPVHLWDYAFVLQESSGRAKLMMTGEAVRLALCFMLAQGGFGLMSVKTE